MRMLFLYLLSSFGYLSCLHTQIDPNRITIARDKYEKISYEDFKRIKYDRAYHKPLQSAMKLEPIFHLSPENYPEIAESIQLLAHWNRETDPESKAAALFNISLDYIQKNLEDISSLQVGDELDEIKLAAALRHAQNYFQEHFGGLQPTLGELQRHSRGEVDLPIGGGKDVLTAISARQQPDGRLRARAGESYIELVRFSKDGPEIETINAFGASAKPDSPHYTDQMKMYVKQQLKPMTLDKEKVLQEAVRIYHPK